jgi:hypothetical protein
LPAVRRFERCRIEMYFIDPPPPHLLVITRGNDRAAVRVDTRQLYSEVDS